MPDSCWVDPFELGTAPANNAPAEVPELVVSVAGGYLFPESATRNVLWRLRCLERWPELAQIKLDEQKAEYEYRLQREQALVDRTAKEATVLPPSGPPWSTALLAIGSALLTGVIVGGLAVYGAVQ